MKKLLSLLLVLCMLFTGCILFASCGNDGNDGDDNTESTDDGNVDVGDMTDNAAGVIANGTSKSFANFFDIAGIGETADKAMQNGSVTFAIDGLFAALGLSDEIPALSATQYVDTETHKLAYEFVIDNNMKMTLWADKNGVTISGNEALLGSNKSFKLDIANLKNDLQNSEFAAMLEDMPEMLAKLEETLMTLWATVFDATETTVPNNEAIVAWTKNVIGKFNPVVTEETVNGTEVVTLTYTFSNETIAAAWKESINGCPEDIWTSLVDMFKDAIPDAADLDLTKETVLAQMDGMIAQMNEAVEIDLTVSVSVAKEGGALVATVAKGKVAPKAIGGEANVDLSVALSESEITLSVTVDVKVGEETAKAVGTLALTKTEKDGKNIISIDADATYKQGSMEMKLEDVLQGEISYEKNTGNYAVSATINAGDITGINVKLEGTAKVQDGKATVTVDKVGYMNISLTDLGLSVVFDSNANVPAIPADAQNLLSMTMEQLMELAEELEAAPVIDVLEKIEDLFKHETAEMVLEGTFAKSGLIPNVFYAFTHDGSFVKTEMGEDDGMNTVTGIYEIHGDTILFIYFDDEEGHEVGLEYSFEYDGDTITIDGDEYVRMNLDLGM